MINKVAVKALFDHYHKKVQTSPNLYTNARDRDHAVLVVLPKELLDYANRGAGHSGFGAGARPVGIRRVVNNATSYLKSIFSSVEALTTFIESSECDADEYIAEVKERHANSISKTFTVKAKVDPKTADEFWNRYGKEELQRLITKFGRDVVQSAYNTLTITEFENRFDLSTELEVA